MLVNMFVYRDGGDGVPQIPTQALHSGSFQALLYVLLYLAIRLYPLKYPLY